MKQLKIPLLCLLSFALSVCPVAIYFWVNAHRYISTVPEGIRLGAGAVLLLGIVFLKVIGKLKVSSRTTLFGMVFVLCYLMQAVLNDLLIFTFLALCGEIMDSACQIFIRRARREQNAELSAKITAKEIERIVNGRV